MDTAIFIHPETASRIAAMLNAKSPRSAVVRTAKRRSCILGYHVCWNGFNLTENELEQLS